MWSAQLFLAHGSIQCTFTVTERCALGKLQDAVCPLPNNLFAIAVGIMSLRQKNWGSGLYPGSSPMTLSNFFPSGDLVFSSKHVCVDKIVFPIRFPTSFIVLLWLCEFPPHTHTHTLSFTQELHFYSFAQQTFLRLSVVPRACSDSPQESEVGRL